MNKILFKVEDRKTYDSGYQECKVNILIDGKHLAEIMKEYEMPMAVKEGNPSLAGDYSAIDVASSSLKQYYFGKDKADWGDEKNKTAILGCSCGNLGCWPLLCKINKQGTKVVWSDFEQPHRDEDWDYKTFESFVFDKQQYLNAIDAIDNA